MGAFGRCDTCAHEGCCDTHCGGLRWSAAEEERSDETDGEETRWLERAMYERMREVRR